MRWRGGYLITMFSGSLLGIFNGFYMRFLMNFIWGFPLEFTWSLLWSSIGGFDGVYLGFTGAFFGFCGNKYQLSNLSWVNSVFPSTTNFLFTVNSPLTVSRNSPFIVYVMLLRSLLQANTWYAFRKFHSTVFKYSRVFRYSKLFKDSGVFKDLEGF